MQTAVNELLSLGKRPDCREADADTVRLFQDAIARIKRPVSDEEARALLRCFGPADCFGLAWELVRAVETSPGWPLADALKGNDGQWTALLRERCSS
jgi:hypothetical protein